MITTLQIACWMPFAALFVWYTVRRRALTISAALLAAGMGLWIPLWAGWIWLIPLFFFFISSTILGKILKPMAEGTDAKHGKARDVLQVICNGGVYAFLSTWAQAADSQNMTTMMAASLAVSTADTWASEIGIYFRRPTFDVLRWKKVPVGVSGGVSGPGTLGAFLGATSLSAVACACGLRLENGIWVTFAGFFGMLLDSLLGACAQARYLRSGEDTISDQAMPDSVLYSGIRWVNNDGVNLISNVLVTALVWFLLIYN
ncbi:MAG: DUF92 domain-containing protein [Bacteroidetes bacterium]|nr:DUF92 domain-containing protein [Bacteroidota bacterium]